MSAQSDLVVKLIPKPEPRKPMNTAKPKTKATIIKVLSARTHTKKSLCGQILNSLTELAKEEVKSTGVFTIPGLIKIKTRMQSRTKGGEQKLFGKTVMVKAKPPKRIVKAFPLSGLRKSI